MLVGASALGAAAESATTAPGSLGAALRDGLLLKPGLIYLNSGTLGASPARVLEATVAAWRDIEQDPADILFGPYIVATEQVRAKAAAFLNCGKEEMAITASTTDGMNIVAQGIDWHENDRVLTTDHEHPGGEVCWEYFAKRRGVVIDKIQLPLSVERPEQVVDLLAAKLTRTTRVISVSHVLYTTGLRMPIARISELAKKNGSLLVVDGAQALGLPVDVKALGCHAYATSAHKWLLAPKGTGLLYISTDAGPRIDPLYLQSGRQVYTATTGTRAVPLVMGLGAAIDYVSAPGNAAREAHVLQLREALVAGLRANPRIKVYTAPAGEMASSIVTCAPISGPNYVQLTKTLLDKYNIVVGAKDRVSGLRVSLHMYNSLADVDALLKALRTELA
jgi:selenocysteine lyase/cysteine desulfurase